MKTCVPGSSRLIVLDGGRGILAYRDKPWRKCSRQVGTDGWVYRASHEPLCGMEVEFPLSRYQPKEFPTGRY